VSHADLFFYASKGQRGKKSNQKTMKKILLSVLALLAFAGSGTAQNLPSYVPANGLVGWWPFNGNANDESGNNNNGTVNGATLSTDRFGNVGSAYGFDGVDDLILTNYSGVLGDTSRTISVWAKSDTAIYFSTLVGYGSKESIISGGTDRILFYIRKIDFEGIALDIDGGRVTYQCNPLDNNWHHFVFVFDKSISPSVSDIKIYFDGNLLNTQLENYVPFPAAGIINTQPEQPVTFGGFPIQNDPNSLSFTGSLDDIAIYNRALTQQEITALYQGANTTANCPTFPASLTQGLVGYWPFCGNALDESGNNNHGTVNGATLTTDRFGNQGSAYGFDGNDFIDAGDSMELSSFSISAWANSSVINGQQGIISQLKDWGSDRFKNFHLYFEQDSSCGIHLGNGIDYSVTPSAGHGVIQPNNWYHLTATHSQDSAKLFINGVLRAKMVVSNYVTTPNPKTYFGARVEVGPGSPGTFFQGTIDDIAIWNRALSQNEITQLYNHGVCQTSITVTDTLLIHTGITSYNPVAYQNTLKVWPNPGNQDITLDAGNLNSMQGWKYKVANGLGQIVKPETAINQQQTLIDLTTWGGSGI
jgi:hypothetical protein